MDNHKSTNEEQKASNSTKDDSPLKEGGDKDKPKEKFEYPKSKSSEPRISRLSRGTNEGSEGFGQAADFLKDLFKKGF